jgi:hypothetical protein
LTPPSQLLVKFLCDAELPIPCQIFGESEVEHLRIVEGLALTRDGALHRPPKLQQEHRFELLASLV